MTTLFNLSLTFLLVVLLYPYLRRGIDMLFDDLEMCLKWLMYAAVMLIISAIKLFRY